MWFVWLERRRHWANESTSWQDAVSWMYIISRIKNNDLCLDFFCCRDNQTYPRNSQLVRIVRSSLIFFLPSRPGMEGRMCVCEWWKEKEMLVLFPPPSLILFSVCRDYSLSVHERRRANSPNDNLNLRASLLLPHWLTIEVSLALPQLLLSPTSPPPPLPSSFSIRASG